MESSLLYLVLIKSFPFGIKMALDLEISENSMIGFGLQGFRRWVLIRKRSFQLQIKGILLCMTLSSWQFMVCMKTDMQV